MKKAQRAIESSQPDSELRRFMSERERFLRNNLDAARYVVSILEAELSNIERVKSAINPIA